MISADCGYFADFPNFANFKIRRNREIHKVRRFTSSPFFFKFLFAVTSHHFVEPLVLSVSDFG